MSGQQDLFRRLLAEKTDAARRPPAPSRFGSGHRSRGDDDGPPEEREGTIESVIHQSEDDFRVIRVRVGSSSEVWRGKMPAVAKGQPVIGTGRAVDHPQHGHQFVVIDVQAKLPSSKEGVRHFLLGLGVKGLGPKKIDAAVEHFGEGVKDALDQPLLLATVRGINADLANRTTEAWQAEKASRAEVMKLEEYGASALLANRIVRHYKAAQKSAVEVVEKNPYRLALDVDGVGFTTADEIALKMGIGAESPERVKAGLLHLLHEATGQGHCFVRRQALVDLVAEKLTVDPARVEQALGWLTEDRRVVVDPTDMDTAHDAVFPVKLHRAEEIVAERLATLLATPASGALEGSEQAALDAVAEEAITAFEREAKVTLADAQRAAVTMAAKHKVLVLTGGPGVGKSFVTKAVLETFRRAKLKVSLAAPTGRAAKRLGEATGAQATTIHRLLEVDPISREFVHHAGNRLKTNVVIVDEASMIDLALASDLLAAIPDGARVVFIGDVDQLPSVGPGAVLRDIIASGAVPTVRLTHIYRQAAGSTISVNAALINAGTTPVPDEGTDGAFYWNKKADTVEAQAEILSLVARRIPQTFGFKPDDIQVLTPMHKGDVGTIALNAKLQQILNPDGQPVKVGGTELRVGDRVIVTKNNRDLDVSNGDIGRVAAVDPEDSDALLVVDIDGRQVVFPREDAGKVQLAYAISAHKSQGSGFPCVVVALAMQHYMLLTRNLLYTAVTRGKKLVVLVADPKAVRMALSTARKDDRSTRLAERLREAVRTS